MKEPRKLKRNSRVSLIYHYPGVLHNNNKVRYRMEKGTELKFKALTALVRKTRKMRRARHKGQNSAVYSHDILVNTCGRIYLIC